MNEFKVIKEHYKACFKSDIANWEVNMWWYGQAKGWNKADSELVLKRRAHKQRIAREIAPWDVVVRLACSYAHAKLTERKIKFKHGFTYTKLNAFITYLLWSKVQLVRPIELANGDTVNVQTFWSWAVEHRNRFAPAKQQQAANHIRSIFLQAGERLS